LQGTTNLYLKAST